MNIFRRKRDAVAAATSQAATAFEEAEDLHDSHVAVFEYTAKPAKRRTYFSSLRSSPPTADSLQHPKPAVIHSHMEIDQTLVAHDSPVRRSFLGIKFTHDKHSVLRGKKPKGLMRRWQHDEGGSSGSSSEGDSDDTLATKEPRELERSTIRGAAPGQQLSAYAGKEINCALPPAAPPKLHQVQMASSAMDSSCHEDQGAHHMATSSAESGAPAAAAGLGVAGATAGSSVQHQHQQHQHTAGSGSAVGYSPGQAGSGVSVLSGGQRTLSLARKTAMPATTNRHHPALAPKAAPVAKSPLLNIGSRHHQHKHYRSNAFGSPTTSPELTPTTSGTRQTHAKSKPRVHGGDAYEGTGALSGILAPPPPSAHEQQKMDAWAADDDDVSNYEYDVSGAFYDMPSLPKTTAGDIGDRYALAATVGGSSPKQQQKRHDRRGCSFSSISPTSRLSSSSTVIESDELTAEQLKHIFVASARKLRWQKPQRGISGLMHIRNTMAQANARYMARMGGERLDKYQQVIVSLSDLYTNEGSVPSASRCDGLYTLRSAGAQWRVDSAAPSQGSQMAVSRDQRAGEASESDSGVDQSPIADSELLGFGSGDLVSLVPVRLGEQAPVYRPRRRRGAARRGNYLMPLSAIPVQ